MRPWAATIVLSCSLLGCPRGDDSKSSTTATSTKAAPTATYDLPPIPSVSASSSASASASAAPVSFDRLAETLAALAADPTHHSPTQTQKRPGEIHYAFAIPGVKQDMLAVVEGRPDAWMFNVYANGVAPENFGALKPMRSPPAGGAHWLILDGALKASQLFRSPDDPSLFVLQSPTWIDAHE